MNIKNTFKNIGTGIALAANMLLCAAAAYAAQPVTYSATTAAFTNSLTAPTIAGGLPTTNPVPAGTFVITNTLGTATMTNFDSLLQSQFSLYLLAVPDMVGSNVGMAGSIALQAYVSPDGISWIPYTNNTGLVMTMNPNTNQWSATNFVISAGAFRFFTVSNIVNSVTNGFFTNSWNNSYEATNNGGICSSNGGGYLLKFFYKLP